MTPNDEYRTLLATLEHLNRLRTNKAAVDPEHYAQAIQKLQADHRERLDTVYQIQFATLDNQHGKRVTLPTSSFQRWDPYECHVVRIDDDETGDMHLIAIHPERLDMVDWTSIRAEAIHKALLGLPKTVAVMVLASYDKWVGIVKQDGDTAQGDLWNPALEAAAPQIQASWGPTPTGLNGHITEKGWYPDPDKCHPDIVQALKVTAEQRFAFTTGRGFFNRAWEHQPEALAEIMHHFDAWEAKHYTPSTS